MQLRRLVAIIGEAALSSEDHQVLEFAERFEKTFVGQGMQEYQIKETLDLAWNLLSIMPAAILKRVPQEFIEQYYHPDT